MHCNNEIENRIWKSMIQRCTNPNRDRYPRYGGRGIKVCDRWREFANFFADMGERPSPDHSIDRIDNDGDYCPDNCRWATDDEQRANRSDNRILTANNQTLTVKQWADKTGIKYRTILDRLNRGWNADEALSSPSETKYSQSHFLTFNNETLTAKQWADRTHINYGTIVSRLRHGWSVERALTTPAIPKGKGKGQPCSI